MQVEAERQQLLERVERQEEDHKVNTLALEEKSQDAENQIKDLKETIFELEDQVEQQRAVRLHTNQTILDLESKTAFFSVYQLASITYGLECMGLTAPLQPMLKIQQNPAKSEDSDKHTLIGFDSLDG